MVAKTASFYRHFSHHSTVLGMLFPGNWSGQPSHWPVVSARHRRTRRAPPSLGLW